MFGFMLASEITSNNSKRRLCWGQRVCTPETGTGYRVVRIELLEVASRHWIGLRPCRRPRSNQKVQAPLHVEHSQRRRQWS